MLAGRPPPSTARPKRRGGASRQERMSHSKPQICVHDSPPAQADTWQTVPQAKIRLGRHRSGEHWQRLCRAAGVEVTLSKHPRRVRGRPARRSKARTTLHKAGSTELQPGHVWKVTPTGKAAEHESQVYAKSARTVSVARGCSKGRAERAAEAEAGGV